MSKIPEPGLDDAGHQIPAKVAEYPDQLAAPEERPFLLSFARYNNKLCQIGDLQKNQGRRATELLKTIGNKLFSIKDFHLQRVDCLPVKNEHGYTVLFSKLGPDIEMKEAKLQDTGRIFYFIHDADKVVYVVAIRHTHFETDKNHR